MMGAHSRDEILAAFERYKEARDEASRTGDWSIWAAVFTEDAEYVEHAYGELKGRAAIREWITGVMAPFPRMTFPQDWWVLDEERGAIVFQCQNQFPAPLRPDGKPFQFPNWTRIVYGGGGLWKSEEDVYNPARDAPRVFKAWIEAGGRLEARETVTMKHPGAR
ncbi:MAG TPA: nuclear transport factor 2 family protein [Candidatus Eisenbacteria bacterium]|nr:nuclear transport factor 2 family protein [Candidatus Eisenbacteria bacterium]